MSWKRKLATVMGKNADFLGVSPLSEQWVSLVLTFHMDWTADQKQAFWNCNDEEQSLITNLLEDTVHL